MSDWMTLRIGTEWLWDGWGPVLLTNHNKKLILLGYSYHLERINYAIKLIKQKPWY